MKNKLLFLSALMLCFTVYGIAQPAPLPPAYHTLKTAGEKAAYLSKIIDDSLDMAAYEPVPSWCHLALSLASKSKPDTLSPLLYQYLGDAYEQSDSDSAVYYYRRSLTAFNNRNFRKKLYLQQSLLFAYSVLDKKDSMLFYIHELEKSIAPLPDTNKDKLIVTNSLANGYCDINQYEHAIRNFRFVTQQALKTKDSLTLRNALANTGLVYNQISNDSMAIYYTRQALPYLGDDAFSAMVVFGNLTDYYAALGNLDSANFFLKKAETFSLEIKDRDALHAILLRKANVLLLEKKYTLAEPLLQKSLAYFQTQPPGGNLVNCLLIYAALDTCQKNYTRAETHLRALYEVTKAMNQKVYTVENLRMLAVVNEKLGDYRDAYLYQKQFIAINDSIKADKAKYDLADLHTLYQTHQKEEQIALLQKESRIRKLELQAAQRNKTLFVVLSIVLLAAFASILYIRHLRNKAAVQGLRSTLEMKALRSQMNPHFIFNSLNSIQKYIWENRREDAAEYLTKFARLIRLVLENSMHPAIELREELHALRLYIEMEHRRNNQKFDYTITVAEHIDVDITQIPPLLLQPYVENAVWHGLSQKDGRGKLSISIEKEGNTLICTIDDDGIGRSRSAEIKTDAPGKTSLAMNISSQRIAWLQKDTGLQASVMIQDKYNNDRAAGTTVLLHLPIIVNHD